MTIHKTESTKSPSSTSSKTRLTLRSENQIESALQSVVAQRESGKKKRLNYSCENFGCGSLENKRVK